MSVWGGLFEQPCSFFRGECFPTRRVDSPARGPTTHTQPGAWTHRRGRPYSAPRTSALVWWWWGAVPISPDAPWKQPRQRSPTTIHVWCVGCLIVLFSTRRAGFKYMAVYLNPRGETTFTAVVAQWCCVVVCNQLRCLGVAMGGASNGPMQVGAPCCVCLTTSGRLLFSTCT